MTAIIQVPTLIDKLAAKQRAQSKSDTEFAATLGVSRNWWNLARNGHAQIGDKVLSRIVYNHPDLDADVLAFLREKAII